MNLPPDESRCDGLLPKMTTLNGTPHVMWSIDCPRREDCARYCQMERDTDSFDLVAVEYSPYVFPSHAPEAPCPHFIEEKTD